MKSYSSIKKSTLALGIILSFGLSANAQSINIQAGLNSSRIAEYYDGEKYYYDYNFEGIDSGSDAYEYTQSRKMKYLYGYCATVSYEKHFNNRLAIEAGVKLSTSGFRIEAESNERYEGWESSSSEKGTMRLTYIETPFLLKFDLYNENEFRIYGNAGLTFGVGITGKMREEYYSNYNGEIYSDTYEEEMDLNDYDMRLTSGLIGGLGVEYKNIFFEANYSSAIMNVTDIDGGDVLLRNDLSLSLGYKFRLNK